MTLTGRKWIQFDAMMSQASASVQRMKWFLVKIELLMVALQQLERSDEEARFHASFAPPGLGKPSFWMGEQKEPKNVF
jgi:hypothetical protein